ncbi:hypothetical protein KA107_02875 [Candidatus Pacearchaeota archaeon]|nr:hypothetical protein [Candidatus Pacearchaeota archaeon]
MAEKSPEAQEAEKYLNSLGIVRLNAYQSAFASCSIENNPTARLHSETLYLVLNKRPIPKDRLMALVESLKSMEEIRK